MKNLGRTKSALVTGGASILAKGIQFLVVIITVPWLYEYLGQERYGLVAMLTSINVLLNFSDFGIGNGLLTLLAQSYGRNDRQQMRQLIAGAFVVVGFVCAVFVVILITLLPLVSWSQVWGVQGTGAAADALPATAIVIIILILSIPANIGFRVRSAMQRGYISAYWEMVGHGVSFIAIWFAISEEAAVFVIIGAMLLPITCAQIANTLHLLYREEVDLRPRWFVGFWGSCKQDAFRLFRCGSGFFILQLATVLTYSLDALFCSHIIDVETAADLSIVQRLFVIPTVFLALLLSPLWPAYSEALEKKDVQWVRKTWRLSWVFVSLSSILLIMFTIFFDKIIFSLWMGPIYHVDSSLVLACACAVVAMTVAHAASLFANGAGLIRAQAWCGVAMLISTPVAKVAFCYYLGAAGLPWATVVVTVLLFALPVFILSHQYIRLVEQGRQVVS